MFRSSLSCVGLLLLAQAAFAAKTNLETDESCRGLDCAGEDVDIELPKTQKGGVQPARGSESVCLDIAQRVYSLCLATPKSNRRDCLDEYDAARRDCGDLAAGTDSDDKPAAASTPDCDAYPFTETAAGLGIVYDPDSNLSNGVYRVPYENGIEVNIAHDYANHNGPGKIDMMGRGGKPYKIVAAADGCIMYIQDARSKQQNPKSAYRKGPCKNNFVWIKHANGEWSKYSHMQQFSTTKKAGLKVGDFVAEGDYLGDQGTVGCSFPAHLHFEVVAPTKADPGIDTKSGGINGWSLQQAKNPFICGIGDITFQNKANYFAAEGPGQVSPGAAEIRRHGMPFHNYRCLLRRGVLAGYQPGWIDFFTIDKEVYVNVVLKPATTAWQSRSGMDGGGFNEINTDMKNDGYRLIQLESYHDNKLRYAAFWEKTGTLAQKYYYGVSESRHSELIAEFKSQGFRPRNISVISKSGLKFTSLWEKASGAWELRSQLTIQEYRDLAKSNRDKGLEVVYLNSYVHKKTPYISAIWHSGVDGEVRRRTDLGKKDFDFEWDLAYKQGMRTIALSAHENDGTGKYSAVFGE